VLQEPEQGLPGAAKLGHLIEDEGDGLLDATVGVIKALVVMRAGSEGEAQALKAHCRHLLAAYKVPKVIEFTTALPRTSSGKLKRFELA
jgi:long-chain acyl-CoA synthetase